MPGLKGKVDLVGSEVIESIEAKHCSTKRRRRSSRKRNNNANSNKKKNNKKKKRKTSTRAAKAYVDDACEEASSDGSTSNVFEDFMPSRNKDDYSIGSKDSNEGDPIQYPGEDYNHNDDDDSFIVASDIEDDELSSDDSHVDFGGNQRRDVNEYLYHDGANYRFELEGLLNNNPKKKRRIDDSSSSEEEEEEEEVIEDDRKPSAVTVVDSEKERILNERARESLKIPNPLHLIQIQLNNANAPAPAAAAAAAVTATAAVPPPHQQQQSYVLRPQQSTVPYLISYNVGGGYGEGGGVKDVDIDEVLKPYAANFNSIRGQAWEIRVRDMYKHMKSTDCSYVTSTSGDPCIGDWARDLRRNKDKDKLQDWKVSILNQIGFAWSR